MNGNVVFDKHNNSAMSNYLSQSEIEWILIILLINCVIGLTVIYKNNLGYWEVRATVVSTCYQWSVG